MTQATFEQQLEQHIRCLGEDAGALFASAQHHLRVPGKRTRAKSLAAMSTSALPSNQLVAAAAAIELVHEASIVHDDIQDRAEQRRGQASVWRAFGGDTALLLGDHLISCAFKTIALAQLDASRSSRLILALTDAISSAAAGQHTQLEIRYDDPHLFTTYQQIAIGKTGALLALPLQFATILQNQSAPAVVTPMALAARSYDAAKHCGQQLGLAYQIIDDLKTLRCGNDLATDPDVVNRAVTAPIVAARMQAPHRDPFRLLVEQPNQHPYIVAQCEAWLGEALHLAEEAAATLPQPIQQVVSSFTKRYLRLPDLPRNRSTTGPNWAYPVAAQAKAI